MGSKKQIKLGMGYLLISLCIVSFGISNCLWVYPLKKLSHLQVIILRSFLTSLLFGSLLALNITIGVDSTKTEMPILFVEILKAVALSGFSYFGLFFYVKSLPEEKVSIAVPVSSISSFFGVLTAVLFLKDKLSLSFYVTAITLTIGVLLIDDKPLRSVRLTKGITYNLIAAFFWGVSFALFGFPVKAIGVVTFSLILELTVCLCSIILFRIDTGKWSFPIKQIDNSIFLLAILGFGGVVFYNLSVLYLPISMISLLSMLTPIVSIVGASILFKERLTRKQYVGISVIFFGLTILKQ